MGQRNAFWAARGPGCIKDHGDVRLVSQVDIEWPRVQEGIDAVSTGCIETDNGNIGPKCGGPFSVTDGEADIRVCEDERDDLGVEPWVEVAEDRRLIEDVPLAVVVLIVSARA